MESRQLASHFLCELTLRVEEPVTAICRPGTGARLSICYLAGGEFRGPGLSGKLLRGGGDWAIYRDERTFDIDVRALLETDDGAPIYLTYSGLWRSHAQHTVAELFEPGGYALYNPAENYVRVAARFETDASQYEWLNDVVAVGVGELREDGSVRYEFFAVD